MITFNYFLSNWLHFLRPVNIPFHNPLVTGLLYTWLTLVGLHVEAAAGGGRGSGGRRRGGGAISRAGALVHAALGGGRGVAIAGGWG